MEEHCEKCSEALTPDDVVYDDDGTPLCTDCWFEIQCETGIDKVTGMMGD